MENIWARNDVNFNQHNWPSLDMYKIERYDSSFLRHSGKQIKPRYISRIYLF